MKTNVGIAFRSSPHHAYEDRYRQLRENHPLVAEAGRGLLFAVMDGVGSASRGMQAAQLIADRLAEFYRPEIEASQAGLVQLLVSINDECHAWGVNPETNRSLGAAVATIAWLAPSRELLVFQAGDTLPLRFDGSRMIELAHRQGSGNCVDKYFGQGSGFNPVCTHSDRRPGQSKIGNFLQRFGRFSDAAEAGEGGCFIHDQRPRHPRSARISGYLPLRVALRSSRLAVRNGPRDRAFFRASAPVGRRPHP